MLVPMATPCYPDTWVFLQLAMSQPDTYYHLICMPHQMTKNRTLGTTRETEASRIAPGLDVSHVVKRPFLS